MSNLGASGSGTQDPESNTIAGAIEYPRRDGPLRTVPEQPRQPRNLQGLLRFAMEATKSEDAPGNSNLGPLDDERRKFLEEALRSMTVDIVEVLRKSIKVLSDPDRMHSLHAGEDLPDDVSQAFDSILEYVDDIDVADDLFKLGGFSIFPVCFGSENEIVRKMASSVLAEISQNNPFIQERTLECGLLNVVLKLAETETGPALVKCVHAISCACREYEPSCRELLSRDGCRLLAELLQRRHEPTTVRVKVCFLSKYLAARYPEAKARYIELAVLVTLADLLRDGHNEASEQVLALMLELLQHPGDLPADDARIQQARGLNLTISEHMNQPEVMEDHNYLERELCETILHLLKTQYPDSLEDVVDR